MSTKTKRWKVRVFTPRMLYTRRRPINVYLHSCGKNRPGRRRRRINDWQTPNFYNRTHSARTHSRFLRRVVDRHTLERQTRVYDYISRLKLRFWKKKKTVRPVRGIIVAPCINHSYIHITTRLRRFRFSRIEMKMVFSIFCWKKCTFWAFSDDTIEVIDKL